MAQLIKEMTHSTTGDLTWLSRQWGGTVERLFYMFNVPSDQRRGGHRHPTCHMALCCLIGSVRLYVQTPQHDRWYTLQAPTDYLLLAPEDWRLMYNFSRDTVLLVLAEKPYARTLMKPIVRTTWSYLCWTKQKSIKAKDDLLVWQSSFRYGIADRLSVGTASLVDQLPVYSL